MNILEADIKEAGYGQKIILNNVSIQLQKGEIVALIGPNGAGKSTLLKVLMGIVKAKEGRISINGVVTTNRSAEENVLNGISFVPQGNRVFTELTVIENLEMGVYLVKDRTESKKRIGKMLEFFPDLQERVKLHAGKLSGGEKQQLAIARALVLNPQILLLDEPSLGLSPKLVTMAFEKILQINEEFKTTILIVEQKVREVLRIAHWVYGMRMGQIVFNGAPTELNQGDTLRKIFLI